MFARAKPNELLVVVRRGQLVARGLGASAWLWPGDSVVRVPATQQEVCFEMTQETSDGIPLRFKGIVIYRVARPEDAARRFDFVGGAGLEQLRQRIAHVCLGELRALAASMTMQACIEGRKTTLADSVEQGLRAVIHGDGAERGWGIDLDIVQVAQVFIIDDDLRKKLEASVRDKVRAASELSRIETDERVRVAQIEAERARARHALESDRQRHDADRERAALEQVTEQARIEAEARVRKARLGADAELMTDELGVRRVELELAELRAAADAQRSAVEHERRKEILRLEQDAAIAQSLAGMWDGAHVSVYGDEARIFGAVTPVVDMLVDRLRAARAK